MGKQEDKILKEKTEKLLKNEVEEALNILHPNMAVMVISRDDGTQAAVVYPNGKPVLHPAAAIAQIEADDTKKHNQKRQSIKQAKLGYSEGLLANLIALTRASGYTLAEGIAYRDSIKIVFAGFPVVEDDE